MMHKAWSSIEKVSYIFQSHLSSLKVTRDKKIVNFDPIWVFPDCISRLNWLMAMKWYAKLEVAQKRCPIVFQGHPSRLKFADFDPNWAFPDYNSSLNSLMAMKWCTKLEAAWKNPVLFSCDQAALQMVQSVFPPVCLWHIFHYVSVILSSWNLPKLLPLTEVMFMWKVKVRGQRSRSQRSWLHLAVSGL